MRNIMEPLTEKYFKACQSLGLETIEYDKTDAFQVMIGNTPYYFSKGLVPNNDCVGVTIASNKLVTNYVLRKAGVPVPDATAINRKHFKDNNWRMSDVSFPVVAKPTWGTSGGMGVVCNIPTKRALKVYLEEALKEYESISVESFKPRLISYRVLMLDGKVLDYYMRVPCDIVGDGQSTIKQLIETTSKAIKAGKIPHRMFPPVLNEETNILLKEQGLKLESVPKKDQNIRLRYACNEKLGGYYQRVDDKPIHKDNIDIMKKAAKAVELNLVGIDILCEDIAKSIKDGSGYIIEMNGAPDIRTHESLRFNNPILVSTMIVKNQIRKHPWFCYKLHLKKHWVKYLGVLVLLSGCIGVGFVMWPF